MHGPPAVPSRGATSANGAHAFAPLQTPPSLSSRRLAALVKPIAGYENRGSHGSEEHLSEQLPRLKKRNWVLDLHVDPKDLINHERCVRALPTVTIIDHMARVRGADGLNQPAFLLLLDLLKDDRFWVKLCCFDKISAVPKAHVEGSLPFMDMVPFAQAVIEAAPDRMIWGTDWPHGNTFTPGRVPNEGDLLDLLAVIAPDAALRKRILVDNPARLSKGSLMRLRSDADAVSNREL